MRQKAEALQIRNVLFLVFYACKAWRMFSKMSWKLFLFYFKSLYDQLNCGLSLNI